MHQHSIKLVSITVIYLARYKPETSYFHTIDLKSIAINLIVDIGMPAPKEIRLSY